MWSASAYAGRRKRVVVLDFEGPKAERFHADLVKLLKHHDTVLSTEKWNGVANDLDAATITERNVKKVARKLKIDAVIEGTIVKRRDAYIIRIKLRGGTNGAQVGDQIDTKSNESRLDSNARRDLQDQLVGAIDALPTNRNDGGDDEDGGGDDSASRDRHHDGDDGDDSASRDRHRDSDSGDDGDDGDSKRHHGFSRDAGDDLRGGDKVGKHDKHDKHHRDDDGDDASSRSHDDDDNPVASKDKDKDKGRDRDRHASDDQGDSGDSGDSGSGDGSDDGGDDSDHGKDHDKGHGKRVASSDDGDGGDGDGDASASASAGPTMSPAIALSPGQRAIDATAGLSFVQRHLAFKYVSTLAAEQIPPGYKQTNPVAGATVDVAVFPLAFGHHNRSALAGLGIEALYDQVLFINSRKLYGAANNMVATLSTTEMRYSVGAVFRHPFGVSATAPIIGGKLTYGQQAFTIQQTLPDMTPTDIPNVRYSTIGLGAFGTYPINPKISLSLDLAYLIVSSTGTGKGDIGNPAEYGKAGASGVQAQLGGEYRLNDKLFLRADIRVENISMTFPANTASLANNRDSNNMTQDVFGASDLYFGGMATIGYAY